MKINLTDEIWRILGEKIAIISFITILVVLKLSVKKSPARPRSNLVIPGPGQKLAPGRSLLGPQEALKWNFGFC